MTPIKNIDKIINDSFGLGASSLFSSIESWNSNFSFQERKEAFFWLIDHLLKVGVLKFVAPNADCYISPANPNPYFKISDQEAQWNAEPQEIVDALRKAWPSHALNSDDIDLNIYFYEIPAIIWVKNGEFYSS